MKIRVHFSGRLFREQIYNSAKAEGLSLIFFAKFYIISGTEVFSAKILKTIRGVDKITRAGYFSNAD